MSERELPHIQTYEARDGRSLCYRHYEADSDKIIILLHGISEDGQYLHPLAEFISKLLQAMTQPTLVLIGEKEEVFIPGQYAPLFAQHNQAKVTMILNSDHDGILSDEETFRGVESWLRSL
jgi:hypothetical protein